MKLHDEYLFTVDSDNNRIPSQTRSFIHSNGLWHRTTAIWVLNKNKQILCQQRSLTKDLSPGKWEACFGGHVERDQEAPQNAMQELREELGLQLKDDALTFYKLFKNDKPRHKTFVYVFATLVDNTTFNIQHEEVEQVEWRDFNDVSEILNDRTKTNWIKKNSDTEVLSWLLRNYITG